MVRRPAISFRHSMSAESYRGIVIDRPGSGHGNRPCNSSGPPMPRLSRSGDMTIRQDA